MDTTTSRARNLDGFEEYPTTTVSVPPAFTAFVSIFVIFCVGFAKPLLACWIRNQKLKVRELQRQYNQESQDSPRRESHTAVGEEFVVYEGDVAANAALTEKRLDLKHDSLAHSTNTDSNLTCDNIDEESHPMCEVKPTQASGFKTQAENGESVIDDLYSISNKNASLPFLLKSNFNEPNPNEIKMLQECSQLPNDHEKLELRQCRGQYGESDQDEQQQKTNTQIPNTIDGNCRGSATISSQVTYPGQLVITTGNMQYDMRQTNPVEQADDSSAELVSNVPSAATTSLIHDGLETLYRRNRIGYQRTKFKQMRRNHGKPSSNQERLQQSFQQELQHSQQVVSKEAHGSIDLFLHGSQSHRGSLSDVAGSALRLESTETEIEYFRKKFSKRPQSSNAFVSGSVSESASVMPPLHPDVLSPEDAASNDPGRSNMPIAYNEYLARLKQERQERFLDPNSNAFHTWFVHLLDLAETDQETNKIIRLAIPSTIWAVFDPLFYLITAALIGNFVNTDSLIAFLLVNLMIRLSTDEISGAISFSESIMLQDAMIQNENLGYYHAGQFMQLAIVLQLLIGFPALLTWIFVMEPMIFWLISGSHLPSIASNIASIASSYTAIIIVDYMLRGVMKMFMLPFCICGQAQFESIVDAIATVLTTFSIAVVAITSDGHLALTSIGWIQVIISIATMIIKISIVSLKGLVYPYMSGLCGRFSLKDIETVRRFLYYAFPQFLGSVVELGEWDVLVLFIRALGGAEVAAWAIMGIIWEIFVALTDGLGEAASVRVSYYLAEGMPSDARHLSNKVSCLAVVLVLFVVSLFLMLGPRIAVLVTADKVIQNLLNQLVGMTCLANSSMTIAQIYWSLAGAQGKFEFASATILFSRWFIIIPLASLIVFRYEFDLKAVAAIVAVGYSVASLVLVCKVFLADWDKIGQSLRERLVGDGIYSDRRSYVDNVNASALVDEDLVSTSTDNDSTLISHRVV